MKRKFKILAIFLVIVSAGLIAWIPYYKWARKHTDWVTASNDHPVECFSCHLYIIRSGPIAKMINEEYLSPFNLALSKDGNSLFTIAQESGQLLITDLKNNRTRGIKVGETPHSIVLSPDEQTAFITNQWSDYVSVIDLKSLTEKEKLNTGNGPAGVILSPDEKFLYVVNSFSNDISIIDLKTRKEIKRLPGGNNPTGIGISPDGKTLYVTSRRALIAPYGLPIETELTKVNVESQLVAERRNVESAYLMENISFTPAGDLAIVTLVRPKNYVPSVQVERGWMINHGIGIIEQKENGRTIQLLLDEPNAYYSDPFDIVVTPDGTKAFISNSGTDCITVVSIDSIRALINRSSDQELKTYANHLGISSRYVLKRIPVGANPKGIAISADGRKLYVAEHLEDKVAVIDTETMEKTGFIDLGGPRRITVARHGRRILNNAGGTFQNQYSCYTCHPDTHEDGLVYNMASRDMGRNLTNTMTLRNIGKLEPFKWTGKNQTIYKQDGIRFSTVLTRTEAYSPKDLNALTAYIMTGIKNPPNLAYNHDGKLTQIQLLGKEIFERTHNNFGHEIPVTNRCITCHPGPFFTNKKAFDVSTLAASDDSVLFDTPHLINLAFSAPYLHDGRALSLEEIWTIYGVDEKHGELNDLTKMELNYLIEYLKSIRDPDYETRARKTNSKIILGNIKK